MHAFQVCLICDLGISPLIWYIKAKYTYNFEVEKFTVSNNNLLEKIDVLFFFQLLVVMFCSHKFQLYMCGSAYMSYVDIHTYKYF